jgi:GDP-4-dehydro-6-deoxy-D-mannose reductase
VAGASSSYNKSTMRALITGITGMIGSHAAQACRELGWETFGIARNSSASRIAPEEQPGVYRCDILDANATAAVFQKVQPDVILHYAAQAFNGSSWDMEWLTHQTNCIGTFNVLDCCRKIVPHAKVLIACSSAEYGDVQPEDCPLIEDRPLRPISPYGVSKVTTECLGFQFYRNYGMKVYLPRLFIHVGTGHPPATAIQNFARQIALIAHGRLNPTVHVGNLQTARDFVDVRDGVCAMLALIEDGEPGKPVNICNGEAVTIAQVLDMLIEISERTVQIEVDRNLLRPSDEPLLLGDNSRLKALGWKRRYTIYQTLQAVYADWMDRVAAQQHFTTQQSAVQHV